MFLSDLGADTCLGAFETRQEQFWITHEKLPKAVKYAP
jgi:hypothetical protein